MPLYPYPYASSGNLQNQYPPAADTFQTTVSTTSNTPCTAGGAPASWLVGLENLSSTAQTAITYTVYDNATTNSGNIVGTFLALAGSQTIIFPGAGIRLQNGCTVVATGGTPVAPGVAFIVR